MSRAISLANPIMDKVNPGPRSAQPLGRLGLPPETVIVSADNHWEISEDIFYESFPKEMKALAPRVWFDRYWHVGFHGKQGSHRGERLEALLEQSGSFRGTWDMEVRLRDHGIEGIQKELVYPQSLLGYVRYPDFAVREQIYLTYNEHLASKAKEAPKRFYGVGVLSNWWDPAQAEAAVRRIVDLGLKTFMVPISPGKRPDGQEIHYADPEMEGFWSAIAEAGLPVSFHIGENFDAEPRGGLATTLMVNLDAFRKPFSQMVFGGVFDRHPHLQVVFAEGGLAWIPPMLQDAEMIFDLYGKKGLLDPMKMRPTDYWHSNCYATFQNDLLGLEQLKHIGADRIMWGSDYPHTEGSFGFSSDALQSIVDLAGKEDARKIVGGTAMELYRLED